MTAGAVVDLLTPARLGAALKAGELIDQAAVVDEAKSAGTHNDGVIREAILAKGREDSLPIKEEDIQINRANSRISVDVNYVVPIEFPGYTYQWHINHHAENPIF